MKWCVYVKLCTFLLSHSDHEILFTNHHVLAPLYYALQWNVGLIKAMRLTSWLLSYLGSELDQRHNFLILVVFSVLNITKYWTCDRFTQIIGGIKVFSTRTYMSQYYDFKYMYHVYYYMVICLYVYEYEENWGGVEVFPWQTWWPS